MSTISRAWDFCCTRKIGLLIQRIQDGQSKVDPMRLLVDVVYNEDKVGSSAAVKFVVDITPLRMITSQ